jgi:hypothetical protein
MFAIFLRNVRSGPNDELEPTLAHVWPIAGYLFGWIGKGIEIHSKSEYSRALNPYEIAILYQAGLSGSSRIPYLAFH